MKFVGIVGAIILILAFTLPAYAETQSVKVSGDLTIRGIVRDEFDLNGNVGPETESFIMTTAEVQIDANLTDNVSTVVRIVNQRDWGDSDYKTMRAIESGGRADEITVGHSIVDLGVDLAYVQIKELFFEPLTIKIGRQDLWFGRGLIIGANQVEPGYITARINNAVLGPEYSIGSRELTAFNSFDAVRATIDFEKYAPVVVDLVYFKNDEGERDAKDDVDVFGVNIGYDWDIYNAEAEGYYWLKNDNSDTVANIFIGSPHQIHTVGARGSFMPNEEFVFGGEAAYQFGEFVRDPYQTEKRDRSAYMTNAFVEYLGWEKYLYSPKLGAEWIFTSGDDLVGKGGGKYREWNAMYRGYYPLLIRPFQGYYYFTSRYPGGEDLGLTNQHEFILSGSIRPLDDITIEAKFAKYYFHENPVRADEISPKGGKDVGSEVDILTTYDYTEDVTLSLLTAWFFPGDVYEHQTPAYPAGVDLQEKVASEVIGSCKVSF